MTKFKTISQSTNCETELLESFSERKEDTIFSVLKETGKNKGISQLYDFKYNDIFDNKVFVLNFLNNFKGKFNEYILRYERLLSESDLFYSVDDYKFDMYKVSQLLQYVSDDIFFWEFTIR